MAPIAIGRRASTVKAPKRTQRRRKHARESVPETAWADGVWSDIVRRITRGDVIHGRML